MQLRMTRFAAVGVMFLLFSCGTSNSIQRYPFRYLSQEVWVLSSLNGVADLQSTFSGELPYLVFGTDGITSGFTGCNNLVGAVTDLNNGFSINRGAYTQKDCPGEGEKLFLEAMRSATDYDLRKGRFSLNDSGREIVVFTPKE